MDGKISDRDLGKIKLVIIQPTPFCNINCSYCYLPDRRQKRVISLETVKRLLKQIFNSRFCDDAVDIVWHAGEPLTMPTEFYSAALNICKEVKPKRVQVTHHIQTNGTLIDGLWCELFR